MVSDTLPTVSVTLMTAVWPGGQRDAPLFELLEARQFGDDVVAAERQQRRAVSALAAGDDDALGAGVGIGDRHDDARQRGPAGVGDRAFDASVDRLDCAMPAAPSEQNSAAIAWTIPES